MPKARFHESSGESGDAVDVEPTVTIEPVTEVPVEKAKAPKPKAAPAKPVRRPKGGGCWVKRGGEWVRA